MLRYTDTVSAWNQGHETEYIYPIRIHISARHPLALNSNKRWDWSANWHTFSLEKEVSIWTLNITKKQSRYCSVFTESQIRNCASRLKESLAVPLRSFKSTSSDTCSIHLSAICYRFSIKDTANPAIRLSWRLSSSELVFLKISLKHHHWSQKL